jgi:hypothetical protein
VLLGEQLLAHVKDLQTARVTVIFDQSSGSTRSEMSEVVLTGTWRGKAWHIWSA